MESKKWTVKVELLNYTCMEYVFDHLGDAIDLIHLMEDHSADKARYTIISE